MALEQLSCKNCGEPLAAGQVNLQTGLASCAACNAVFTVAGQGITPTPAPPSRPPRIETSEFGPAKEWRWKWWNAGYAVLLVFALLWNGFMLFWYGAAIWMILDGESGGWVMATFGLIHLSVGIGIGYTVLAGLRNTTTIRHAPGVLEIAHRPYSRFFGGGQWETRTFTAIRIETIYGNKGRISYRLMAVRSEGNPLKLLSDNERDMIRFLAYDLAAAMKLPLEASA